MTPSSRAPSPGLTLRTDVSVLYVDPRGVYPKLVADWWDEARDARNYAGPNPVVAHPPCSRWCRLAKFIEHRCGHRVGDDGGCFRSALSSVRSFGGILEHPSHSIAWDEFRLPDLQTQPYDNYGGHTIEIEQVAWGHKARKTTWLYIVGIPVARVVDAAFPWMNRGPWAHYEPTAEIGHGMHKRRNYPRIGDREASRTPLAFAEWLIELAAQARRPPASSERGLCLEMGGER